MTVTAGAPATDLTEPLSPDRIMQLGFGFWASRALHTAVELRLFTVLGRGPATRGQVESELGIWSRHGADFLDGLVSLGLIDRHGEGATATYVNTAETAAFLDEASATYVGGILEMAGARLYRFWGGLTEALLTANRRTRPGTARRPCSRRSTATPTVSSSSWGRCPACRGSASRPWPRCSTSRATTGRRRRRRGSLTCIGRPRGAAPAPAAHDVRPAGGRADRDPVGRGSGPVERVSVVAGDFFQDPLPRADVLTMGMILHDWDLAGKMHLLRAAYDALPPGGALIAVESLIDDARRENTFGLLMSLNMLIEFGDAFDYTGADFDGWCRSVGFSRTEVLPLVGGASAAVAYR